MSIFFSRHKGERIVQLVRVMAALAMVFLLSIGVYAGWSAWQLRDKREQWFAAQRSLVSTVSSNSRLINRGYDDFKNILLWYQPQTLEGRWLDSLLDSLSFLEKHISDPEVRQVLFEFKSSLSSTRHLRQKGIVWGERYRVLLEDFEAGRSLTTVRRTLRDLRHALEDLQGRHALKVAALLFRFRGQAGASADQVARQLLKTHLDTGSIYSPTVANELAELTNQVERLAAEYNADSLVDIKDNHLKQSLTRLQQTIRIAMQDQPGRAADFEDLLGDLSASLFGQGYRIDEDAQTIQLGKGGLYALREEFLHLTQQRDWIMITADEEFNRLKGLNDRIMDAFSDLFENIIRQDQAAMHRFWVHLVVAGGVFFLIFLFIAWRISMEASRQVAALHQGREHLRGIMNSMLDGLITIGAGGEVKSFNPAAREIFKIPSDEIIGQGVDALIPDLKNVLRDRPEYLSTLRQESMGQRLDGSRFPLEFALSEIPTPHRKRYAVIIRDITEQKRAEEKLKQLAIHDPLTGLLNRGEGMRILAEEIGRAERYQRPLSVIMLDIDHFKRVNDTYGHAVGDDILCCTAKQMEDLVRSSDAVVRYGGEEMLVMLPETDMAAAARLAERLRGGIAESCLMLESGDRISVTASLGVATYPAHGRTMEAVVNAADQALYRAKAEGRNRVRRKETGDEIGAG